MSKADRKKKRRKKDAMPMDDSAIPALFGLTRPQELPPFGMDEAGSSFAMADDREVRRVKKKVVRKPLTIEESKPG